MKVTEDTKCDQIRCWKKDFKASNILLLNKNDFGKNSNRQKRTKEIPTRITSKPISDLNSFALKNENCTNNCSNHKSNHNQKIKSKLIIKNY